MDMLADLLLGSDSIHVDSKGVVHIQNDLDSTDRDYSQGAIVQDVPFA